MTFTSSLCGPDAVAIMEEAEFQRMYGNKNGFSHKRTHRVIGDIPIEDFHQIQALANARGEEFTGQHLKEYLNRNPQYRTVNAIDTGATGNIIIK